MDLRCNVLYNKRLQDQDLGWNVMYNKRLIINQLIIDVYAFFLTFQLMEDCIQDLMRKVLNAPRASLELPAGAAQGFALLSSLHSCRMQRNFSHTLNDLYSPLLWRLFSVIYQQKTIYMDRIWECLIFVSPTINF